MVIDMDMFCYDHLMCSRPILIADRTKVFNGGTAAWVTLTAAWQLHLTAGWFDGHTDLNEHNI